MLRLGSCTSQQCWHADGEDKGIIPLNDQQADIETLQVPVNQFLLLPDGRIVDASEEGRVGPTPEACIVIESWYISLQLIEKLSARVRGGRGNAKELPLPRAQAGIGSFFFQFFKDRPQALY